VRTIAFTLARVATAAALVTGTVVVASGPAAAATDPSPRPPRVTKGPCRYTETPDDPAPRPVPLPPDPRRTPSKGTVDVDLKTNQGRIRLVLDRAKAPCTVQDIVHLAKHRFYDRTVCHRLTAYPTLSVLQCGDPKGNGEGGPGWVFKDELPTDLPPAPNDPTGQRRIYPRGTVAMANAGPNTNGSQFFLVYKDSVLRPNYTVFGTVDARGMAVLDRIAAGGIVPSPDDPTGVDGTPKLTTRIEKALARC
jgi:peptidyl-prolyl cis-trans isomerase B (cyclophilin B)